MAILQKLIKRNYGSPDISWNKMSSPVMIMMCGLPGCGKTLKAKELEEKYGFKVISSDEIRKEFFGNENSQTNNRKVFEILHERIFKELKNGISIIYDATNINRKKRKKFLNQLKKIKCIKYCYFIPTPYKTCLRNNQNRNRCIPKSVITRMYRNFHVPYYTDGFDKIIIDWSGIKAKRYDENSLMRKLKFAKQDNPHHSYSVGRHCIKTAANILGCEIEDKKQIMTLYSAALLHDIGKPFCKEYDENHIAHYFGHENVSAYMALPYLRQMFKNDDDVLYSAFLINNHMRLMQIESLKGEAGRKARFRLSEKYTSRIVNDLLFLHMADKNAQQ